MKLLNNYQETGNGLIKHKNAAFKNIIASNSTTFGLFNGRIIAQL